MKFSTFFVVLSVILAVYTTTVHGVCDLRYRRCDSNSDCYFDTYGYNACVASGYIGLCQPGGSAPPSGSLCPMKGQSCSLDGSVNCNLATDGATYCNGYGPVWAYTGSFCSFPPCVNGTC